MRVPDTASASGERGMKVQYSTDCCGQAAVTISLPSLQALAEQALALEQGAQLLAELRDQVGQPVQGAV